MKIRVGFYLDNDTIYKKDCSNVLSGNPGIGGTEYMVILIAQLLTMRTNSLEVVLFCPKQGILPKEIICKQKSFNEAIRCADQEGFDYFVFKHLVRHIESGILDSIMSKMRLIPWCHVFQCYWEWDYYASNAQIYKILCVSREMMDLYMDHKGYEKACYIYNAVECRDASVRVFRHPYQNRRHIVTYIGSIVPFKGLHLLTKAWPQVLATVPDAELYIIGSAKLYDTEIKLGRFGIAEEEYEKEILEPILAENKIIPSVHFMGLMGEEKNEILLQTKVGVPNPSGKTETFGISAVEMQMMGAKVTTIVCPGYLETVRNGLLYREPTELADCIINLLQSDDTDYENAMEYFKENFSYNVVASRWEQLLQTGEIIREKELQNAWYRKKNVKEKLRKIKRAIPCLYRFPPLERIMLAIEKYRYGTHGYLEV